MRHDVEEYSLKSYAITVPDIKQTLSTQPLHVHIPSTFRRHDTHGRGMLLTHSTQPLYLLLFTVTPPVWGSYMSPTHPTQPLHLQIPFTCHHHATHRGVVHVTHSLNTTSTSPDTFYFSPSRHPSQSRMCYPHTQHNLYISRALLLSPVTPPVGEPCHSRAVPMTLHNPQWPRDVLGNSGRGWPFTRW